MEVFLGGVKSMLSKGELVVCQEENREVVLKGDSFQVIRGGDDGLLVVQHGEIRPYGGLFSSIGDGMRFRVRKVVNAKDPSHKLIEAVGSEGSSGGEVRCTVTAGLGGETNGVLQLDCVDSGGNLDHRVTVVAPSGGLLGSSRKMMRIMRRINSGGVHDAVLAKTVWGLAVNDRRAEKVFGGIDSDSIERYLTGEQDGVRVGELFERGGTVEGINRAGKYREACRQVGEDNGKFINRGVNGDPVVGELLLTT
jgi:hypothetical protein